VKSGDVDNNGKDDLVAVSENLKGLFGGRQMDSTLVVLLNGSVEPCPADANGDGFVNVDDLFLILGDWGETDSPGDVNDDGVVNVDDLFLVLGNWGPC
jgi:hypothetical protein